MYILLLAHNLAKKKIISINNLNPFDYVEQFGKNSVWAHSRQARYIDSLLILGQHFLSSFPHKKEELKISIKFEGEDEPLEIEYGFERSYFFSDEFEEFYFKEKKRYFQSDRIFPRLEEIEKKFKIKKGLINKLKVNEEEEFEEEEEADMWELKSQFSHIVYKSYI